MKKTISTALLIIISMNITACFGQSTPTKPQKPPQINSQGEYPLTVKLGEPVQETYQRNPNMFEVGESGFGPGFMYTVLPFTEIPKVRVEILDEDYKLALNISDLKDIRFVHDSNYPQLGTGHFWGDLSSVDECQYVTDEKVKESNPNCQPEVISHKIFEQYMTIRTILQKYGWKHYIHPQYPRILGRDSWEVHTYNRDGYYIDSYEKWQKYMQGDSVINDDLYVRFYRKNLILEVSIDSSVPHLEMYTNNFDYLFRYDEKTRGEKWQEYLANDIPKWAKERAQTEAELREKGYTIHKEYEDAPLPEY